MLLTLTFNLVNTKPIGVMPSFKIIQHVKYENYVINVLKVRSRNHFILVFPNVTLVSFNFEIVNTNLIVVMSSPRLISMCSST